MIQRTKIALIMPYFGNFPNYFALWECSASKNRDIDFLVFTNYPRENSYKNIIYIQCEFHEIKKTNRTRNWFSSYANQRIQNR